MTAVSGPCVALAVPRFRAALEQHVELGSAAPVLPGMQWLASRAHRAGASPGDWRTWLLSRFGPGADMLQRCPAGPAVRALATGAREEGCWACAQPVHLLIGLDHLRLAPLAGLQLSTEEARAIDGSIGATLAGSGYSLRPSEAGPWTLACPTEIQCDTVEPAQAEGRDIRDCLPAGRDGAQIRKLMNELQMLLHEHPVNARRAERGLIPVNSFWLWGFGRSQDLEPTQLPTLCTDDPWLRGLWRLHGIAAQPPAAAAGALETEATLLIAAADAVADPVLALERWESDLGAPLAAALRSGRIRSASIRLGDVSYTMSRADRLAVWRRRRAWTELLA